MWYKNTRGSSYLGGAYILKRKPNWELPLVHGSSGNFTRKTFTVCPVGVAAGHPSMPDTRERVWRIAMTSSSGRYLFLLLLVTTTAVLGDGSSRAGNVTSKNETKVLLVPDEYSVQKEKAASNGTERLDLQLATPAKPKTTGSKLISIFCSSIPREICIIYGSSSRERLSLLGVEFSSLISLFVIWFVYDLIWQPGRGGPSKFGASIHPPLGKSRPPTRSSSAGHSWCCPFWQL